MLTSLIQFSFSECNQYSWKTVEKPQENRVMNEYKPLIKNQEELMTLYKQLSHALLQGYIFLISVLVTEVENICYKWIGLCILIQKIIFTYLINKLFVRWPFYLIGAIISEILYSDKVMYCVILFPKLICHFKPHL